MNISSALRFSFKASNNEAEYKALIIGVKLAHELHVEAITIYSDSKLIVGQVTGEFIAREERMVKYFAKTKRELEKFTAFEVIHIIRAENTNVDALAKLASIKDFELLKVVPVGVIAAPSIAKEECEVMEIGEGSSWMDDIVAYLTQERLLEDPNQAKRVKYQSKKYMIYDKKLYKRGVSTPLLRCHRSEEAREEQKSMKVSATTTQGGMLCCIKLYVKVTSGLP